MGISTRSQAGSSLSLATTGFDTVPGAPLEPDARIATPSRRCTSNCGRQSNLNHTTPILRWANPFARSHFLQSALDEANRSHLSHSNSQARILPRLEVPVPHPSSKVHSISRDSARFDCGLNCRRSCGRQIRGDTAYVQFKTENARTEKLESAWEGHSLRL